MYEILFRNREKWTQNGMDMRHCFEPKHFPTRKMRNRILTGGLETSMKTCASILLGDSNAYPIC
jgi:hypothetical protein